MRRVVTVALEIFLCVKHATQVQEPVRFTPDRKNLATENRSWTANQADCFALEEALRLREGGQVETITCLTAGPDSAVEALVYCLAAGADRVVHIPVPDDMQFNPRAVALILGHAIHHFSGSLVFTAQESSDGESGMVPAYLASTIGAAFLSNVANIQLSGNEVEIHRRIERGHRQVWKAMLPAVVAFNKDINLPRYVSVAAMICARQKAIVKLTPEMLGVSFAELPRSTKLERLIPARARSKKLQSTVSGQSAAQRILAITTGGASDKNKKVLQGQPEELAAEAVAHLKEKKLLMQPTQTLARQVTEMVKKKEDRHES
jgi:electron transfer flavoprotein beta subunit